MALASRLHCTPLSTCHTPKPQGLGPSHLQKPLLPIFSSELEMG